jgi:DNA segregation ATPase FtsK/SpoIIIE, S-DNA-T family
MSVSWRSFDASFVSDELRDSLRRRLRDLSGLALLSLATSLGLSLATWSAQDPSLTHAVKASVHNLLGAPGAIVSDLLMQMFGMGSIALIVPVAVWGWRLLSRRPLSHHRLRLIAWLFGALTGTAFASCIPTSARWPLPTGLGGVMGDALLRACTSFSASPASVMSRVIAGTILALVTIAAIAFAVGLLWRGRPSGRAWAPEPRESSDRASWIFGMLAHAGMSVAARVGRLLRLIISAFASIPSLFVPSPKPSSRPSRRVEPRLRTRAKADDAEEQAEDDGDPEQEEEEEEEPEPVVSRRSPPKKAKPPVRVKRADADDYVLPPLNLLAAAKQPERAARLTDAQLQEHATALEGVLGDFGVRGDIINARPGPVVTLFELEPAPGIKSSRVIGLADDIARSMSAVSARVAVVSGRNAIGIELPNPRREKVYLRELLSAEDYTQSPAKLAICLGKTIGGEPVIVDLARMPHLLIAGTTGSGKSVAINTMILSLLYRLRPDQCRLIMIDPKMLELSVYDGIPHLLTPVVTDPKKAVVALKWAVKEMEDRYRKMSKLGVRNIDGYNARVAEANAKGETLTRTVHTGYDKESGEAIYEEELLELEPLPLLVVIVDEMADLMMVAGKDIEGAIQRLAQMARAAGIHVVLATQRPSVDVITGTIKANFPTRISFQVTSKIDSRTILGEQGAEQLLGQGDMLYMAGGGRISRVHGPFCSDEEVEKVVRHLKAQGQPQYLEAVTAGGDEEEDAPIFDATGMGGEAGPDLYAQAVQVVLRDRKASTSYIQRRLQIGYNRAASLMERMEKEGIVGQPNHSGKREILIEAEGAA